MIRANLRQRLTANDFDVAIDLLGRGQPAGTRYYADLLAEEGPDRLLDAPGLAGLLRGAPVTGGPSAPLFFYVIVRHALRDSGIDHVRLSDYLGALLFEFGFRDRAHRIAEHDDEIRRYLVDLVADLDAAEGQRAFMLLAHLGNFSLWMSGVFPDYIAARSARNGAPGVGYYENMGTRGFRLAAEHGMARALDLDDIYEDVAGDFRRIRRVLNKVSGDFTTSPSRPGASQTGDTGRHSRSSS